ncbi:MAG: sulfite exporter TauE/SafE family protein [Rubrivivax sp.]
MDGALVVSATLLGLAGAPHCTAMCGAACTAISRRAPGNAGTVAFHVARVAGYAAAGAVVAASVGALAALGRWSPALRPLWTLVQLAALGLGLWLLVTGRQPAFLERLGRATRAAPADGWQRMRGPAEAALAGGLWFAWPCGLLQSALLVAALANGPAAGAAAMAGFALASSVGLLAAPWLWLKMGGATAAGGGTWPVRAAGALLAAASAWALGHGLWMQVWAWCVS